MALAPPPPRPAAPPKPVPTPLERAKVLEGHIDAWIKGQGPDWQGGEVSLGEHGTPHVAPEVLGEVIEMYKAAGWTGAHTVEEAEVDALGPADADGKATTVKVKRPHPAGVVLVLAR